MKKSIAVLLYIGITFFSHAEDGYRLWLRYDKISNADLLALYKQKIKSTAVPGSSATLEIIKDELKKAFTGLTGVTLPIHPSVTGSTTLIIATPDNYSGLLQLIPKEALDKLGKEGFLIQTKSNKTIITANTDIGLLYGMFHFLRLMQTNQSITRLDIESVPKLKLRMLNHWDNLNRTVERGYAGFSIWDWHKLPAYIDQRYIDYARANASIGINAVSLINVNSNALILTEPYLQKVKALADLFRPYGIRVFLTAKFSAPIETGKLKTADPLNDSVQQWWNEKVNEIYSFIPDFGGFLVKANSEGQPGPQDYKRTHADGANMFAKALAPHHGIVIWRAFVYAAENPEDRHKQAYDDFVPLDGKFAENVIVQVKNGAIDFMPREPFHPLFGAMPKTPLMMEFQITQEYLGQGTSWVYLAPLYKEVLESDTYYKGKGSTVARILDGSLDKHSLTGMAGVSNIGTDIDWCGHPMAQANWYCFGRLSWDHSLSSEEIADEWLRMTFTNDAAFTKPIKKVMLRSREIVVDYMNPLGLHHIMGTGNHYGPAPWVNNQKRPEWNPVYYHQANTDGIGFNRTKTGSNALAQYYTGAQKQWEDENTCDERFLLWFHHVSWNHKMKSGKTLWEELCDHYKKGADSVTWMKAEWMKQKDKIDPIRFNHVRMLLDIQVNEAKWWRNACVLYFQTYSKQSLPADFPVPNKSLEYYESLRFPYAPGSGQ